MKKGESSHRVVQGEIAAPPGARFALVASRFNAFIVDRLVDGALEALKRHGADMANVMVVRVPGAWELPAAAQRLAQSKTKPDAIIALGAVVRGGTPHFDYVAGEASRGLQSVSLATGVPVTFGVLTTNTIEQAEERAGAGGKSGNKGWDAALAALEMVTLARALDSAGV